MQATGDATGHMILPGRCSCRNIRRKLQCRPGLRGL